MILRDARWYRGVAFYSCDTKLAGYVAGRFMVYDIYARKEGKHRDLREQFMDCIWDGHSWQ